MRRSLIYVWLDRTTGRPVYVGKTSATVELRMRTHERVSGRGKTEKDRWLASEIRNGRYPVVRVVDTCEVSRSSAVERRWHSRLSARFDLLNVARPGAGNPGIGRVQWTPELDDLLGSVADAVIAERIGCHRKTVSYRRECLGIPAAFDRTRNVPPPNLGGWNRVDLPDEIIAELGTAPDHVIARRAGTSKYLIGRARAARGIPSYAQATGNDGRIRVGDPHRRWGK